MLTRDEVVARLVELGHPPMSTRTWSSMVSRGQAPRPDEWIGRTPRWSEATVARWRPRGKGARTDTRLTGDLVAEAHVAPARCGHCGTRMETFTTQVDDRQLHGRESWSWQCNGCSGVTSLTRATIVARWRAWRDDQN